ncbi:hypothetical protein [Limnoglobus roseus]|uniref:hypothetical protein n=1 Tax=Limnoglobus roseus TaxID=2598579 RepID=UPI0011EAE577|nr:hypothetical protein [Limnoglobus roseus]
MSPSVDGANASGGVAPWAIAGVSEAAGGFGGMLVGTMTTCRQCGHRTCRPVNSNPTPMRRPHFGHANVNGCMTCESRGTIVNRPDWS